MNGKNIKTPVAGVGLTAFDTYDYSKIYCGICNTELIDNSDMCSTTSNKSWCPKCRCYPMTFICGVGVSPMSYSASYIGIPEEEYNRLKQKEIPQKAIKTETFSQACPVCKSNVNWNYCSNCGQRISYSL